MSEPKHVSELLKEVLRKMEGLQEQIDRIERQSRRPDRIIYRPSELARRLGVSRPTVYNLWNDGSLAYYTDRRGRYSTEEQVMHYQQKESLKRPQGVRQI